MRPDRDALLAQRQEYEKKSHSLNAYLKELGDTCAKCGTDHALFEDDVTKAKHDAHLYEEKIAELDQLLAGEYDEITYWVQKDAAGEWRWNLRAANDRIVADSGEGYKHKHDCLHAIELVKHSTNAPVKEGS